MKLIDEILGFKIYSVDFLKPNEAMFVTEKENIKMINIGFDNADIAPMVEQHTRNVNVGGSSPSVGF